MVEETAKIIPIVKDEIATIAKDIDIFAGWLQRLENPDPVLRTEAAGKGLKLYDEIDRDPHASSVLQQRILAVVGKEWEVIPAKSARKLGRPASTSQEQIVADYVSSVLENCNFDQARQEILKAILYGYYTVEVIWKVENSQVTIRKLIGKHPRRFIFTPERELRLLTLQNMIEGETLPDRKFITFTYGDSDNPYGKGLGQKLWWPVWFKKNGIKFWLVFLEKFGMPTVKGKYPPGTKPELQKALLEAIEAIQTDTGIKIPDSMDIEFLEASRAGTVTYEQLCDYMDRQISKAVLGQTLTTEIKGEGSYAASQTHNEVRQEIIEADADLLDGCLNDTLIRWIVDYNFPGVSAYPKIKTFAGAKPDLRQQSEIDKTLAVDIGVDIGRSYFYETYGIPEPAEGEELVKPRTQAVPLFHEFGEVDAELAIEKERQKFVGGYLAALGVAEQNIRARALSEIVSMMDKGGHLSEAEFIDTAYGILNRAYTKLDRAAIREPLKDCYAFYRLKDLSAWQGEKAPVKFTWGTRDDRTLGFLEKVDRFYLGKYIDNDDMKGSVLNFLKEQYLEKGAGLFGRSNIETITGFRDLFSDKLADISDGQIQRICDTSVARMRNYAHAEQLQEAGVEYATVVAVLDERTSVICQAMNGKKVPVATLYKTVVRETGMSPDEYAEYLQTERVSISRAESGTALPPYHPRCRTRLVMSF